MKKIEDFAKLLSSDITLARKCVETNFDVEAMKKLAAEKGFDFTAEELAPLALSLSIVIEKAKELKLTDEALSAVSGGQKEGYDKPSSVGKDNGDTVFPLIVVQAAVVAALAVSSVASAVALTRKSN